MPNENLIDMLADEINHCKCEIAKADDTIARMQERRTCYDILKTRLEILLDTAQKEGADNG